MEVPFKKRTAFEDRIEESTRILSKFPGRIPVIVEPARFDSKTIPMIDKTKFLVPGDLTLGQFVFIIRRRLTLPAEIALFMFVGGSLPTTNTLMRELYSTHKDRDGFMYATYSGENTFGSPKTQEFALFWGKNNGGIIGVYPNWNAVLDAANKLSEKTTHPDGFAISMIRLNSYDQCFSRGYTTLYNLYSADSILLNTICAMPANN